MEKEYRHNNKVAIYRSADGETQLSVEIDKDTVWLNANQMAELFGRDSKTIRKHINNAIREELAGEVAVYSIDVDQNPQLAVEYKIMNIPALVLLKDGEKAGMTVGFQPKESLKKFIEEHR